MLGVVDCITLHKYLLPLPTDIRLGHTNCSLEEVLRACSLLSAITINSVLERRCSTSQGLGAKMCTKLIVVTSVTYDGNMSEK